MKRAANYRTYPQVFFDILDKFETGEKKVEIEGTIGNLTAQRLRFGRFLSSLFAAGDEGKDSFALGYWEVGSKLTFSITPRKGNKDDPAKLVISINPLCVEGAVR